MTAPGNLIEKFKIALQTYRDATAVLEVALKQHESTRFNTEDLIKAGITAEELFLRIELAVKANNWLDDASRNRDTAREGFYAVQEEIEQACGKRPRLG